MSYRPTNFRSTVIKLYYILPLSKISQKEEEIENIKSLDDDRDELINVEE
jgi:hypothetical protein